MTERVGFDQRPPYNQSNKGFSNQYGGYPQGGSYPPSGRGYPPAGRAHAAQPGYRQAFSQQTTTAVIVNQPGAAGHVIVQSHPPDYMVASICACICCFWPTGLCAIYYASQVTKLASMGDMEGATRMSKNARNLMIASIVVGIMWITLVIVRVVRYSNTDT